MIEPPSPEETERQREKNRKLREQLMRIQRPTEISVPQGEWCCCTTFLIAYHFANEVYGCISVCTIHYHSCVNGFLPGPPMMSYSLPPAAASSTPCIISCSLEPAYFSIQNAPLPQNVPTRPPPYSPMLSVAGSVRKDDTSKPPLPTTASEVLPSSSEVMSPPHSASPNVVITQSDVSLMQQRLAISKSLSPVQSLPTSITMMPRPALKPSASTLSTTSITTTASQSMFFLPGISSSSSSSSGATSGIPFVFGHNSSTGGQSFSFNSSLTATNSVTSSQLPNADSKKGGSGAAHSWSTVC